jgi:hypothetical protein
LTIGPPEGGRERKKKMKNMPILRAGSLLAAVLAALALAMTGCHTPVNVSGDYSTPKETITGDLNATTNGVTLSGDYSTTNQTVGGSVTVGK